MKHPVGNPDSTYPEVADLCSAYLSLIGELIYLSVTTHPDIVFIVSLLTQQNASPEPWHYTLAKHILHYLVGTIDFRLQYCFQSRDIALHAYTDASWANNTTQCSTSIYV